MYADIAPAIPLPAHKMQTYTYVVPEGMNVDMYDIVTVPIGPRRVYGIVMNIHAKKPLRSVRSVTKAHGVQLCKEQVELGKWISRMAHGGLGFTLRMFMPPLVKSVDEYDQKALRSAKGLSYMKDIQGKHAVYIERSSAKRYEEIKRLAGQVVHTKRQALVIVPELWMIDELMRVCEEDGTVAAYHSGLSSKRTASIWHGVREGRISLVITTQKGLFLPFADLDLVVVEQEYYASHKLWDQYPRLDSRRVARRLAKQHEATHVSCGSYPSLSLQHAMDRKTVYVIRNNPLSMRTTLYTSTFEDRKQRNMLPAEYIHHMRKWVARGDRMLLLYNKRGSWNAATCRSCKERVMCPHCSISLVVHTKGKKRTGMCHNCGYGMEFTKECPGCGKKSLRFVGVGGELVEHILGQFSVFDRELVRIDADTIKDMTPRALRVALQNKQIVMGTSALFSHVRNMSFDRVGWIFPERSMQYPDFRSYERAMNLLARLQEHTRPKRNVMLITRSKMTVESELCISQEAYTKRRLKERRRLKYPPYTDLVRITVEGQADAQAMKRAEKVRDILETKKEKAKLKVYIRGPFQGFMRYRKKKAQAHILLAGTLEDMLPLYEDMSGMTVEVDPERIL